VTLEELAKRAAKDDEPWAAGIPSGRQELAEIYLDMWVR
jgi:hypothetical protein